MPQPGYFQQQEQGWGNRPPSTAPMPQAGGAGHRPPMGGDTTLLEPEGPRRDDDE